MRSKTIQRSSRETHRDEVRWVTLVTLALLVLYSFIVTLPARAGKGKDQHQALLELEQRWLEVEGDPDALETILADDFVHVLPFGFVSKSEQLRYTRRHPAPPADRETKRFENLRVRIFGNAGVVNGIVVATSTDGKVRKTIFTDVFAYRNGKWQAVNAQELPLAEAPHQ